MVCSSFLFKSHRYATGNSGRDFQMLTARGNSRPDVMWEVLRQGPQQSYVLKIDFRRGARPAKLLILLYNVHQGNKTTTRWPEMLPGGIWG
jgi:hypothetical protein